MKKILIVLIAAISFNAGNVAQAQVVGGISFNTFYDELSPYGRWIEDPQYGQVWLSSQLGFEPYYDNGHWVFTSYGWTWVSDYPWGWAPFHYGRWAFTSYGWAWVPGYEWAPAWVGWCQNDGYYGWAPLSPGLGFNISFNNIPRDRWRFVQQQYITSPVIFNHYIRPDRNANVYRNITIINNTQTINNSTYVAGPKREEVERVTRKKIEPKQVAFNETTQKTTEQKTQVKMYRPNIKKEEKKNNILLQEPNKNNPAATSQGNMKSVLRDQQKAVQSSNLQRQREERLKQNQYNQPLPPQPGTQKENERHEQVIQQAIERQDAVQQQIFQQQQERIREQKIQKQNNQEEWNQQQQNLQLQKELRQQKMQEQQALQQQREQQQNEMRQQREKLQPPNPPSTLDERKPEQKNKNPF